MMLFPLLLGLWVGALMALTGAGGAVLAVPLLVIVLHLPVAQAAPIGLMAVMLAAGLGALLGLRAGIVRYKAALLMAGLGLLCAPLGFWLGRRLPDPLLVLLFFLVLLYVAVRMWRFSSSQPDQSQPELTPGHPLTAACQFDPRRGGFAWTAPCARRLMYSGALAGLLSGALGVGGGFVLVPALNKVSNLQMKSVVATSLATTALIAVGSILLAACQQAVAWRLALPFAVAAAAGMLVGRKIAEHCQDKLVQRAFAVFALLVALGMGLKACLV